MPSSSGPVQQACLRKLDALLTKVKSIVQDENVMFLNQYRLNFEVKQPKVL